MSRHELTAVHELIARGRSPLGDSIELDLGTTAGPLGELAEILSVVNGFTVFNAGVQVFHAGPDGFGPELRTWNEPDTWKHTYDGLADGLFCFGQDLLGSQFAIVENRQVVTFDPETARRHVIGDSLNDWARWLLADSRVRGTSSLATAWQDQHGPLGHGERLIPLRFFVVGGSYDFANLTAKDAVTCMRIRGPVARRIQDLPDGTRLRLGEPNDRHDPDTAPAPPTAPNPLAPAPRAAGESRDDSGQTTSGSTGSTS